MLHKSFEVLETKADGETGTFEALVSVFNNVDHVGDRILPGAFTKTLEQWKSSGDPIPVILSHNWDDPMAHIGVAQPGDVKQTPRGLVVKGQLDIGDNEVAKQVYRLMKRRSLKAFSFGYTVPEGGEALAEDGANDVTQIDLVEVGPTLKGANPEAQLQGIKSALQNTKELASNLRELLGDAGSERFGGNQTFVYADDWDPDAGWVVYCLSGSTDSRYVRVSYTRQGDGVVLGSDEVEVTRMVDYRPVSNAQEAKLAAEGQRSNEQVEDVKAEDPTPGKAQAQDPLYRRSMETVLEITSAGQSLRKPPEVKEDPKPEPRSEAELKKFFRDLTLETLMTGVSNDEERAQAQGSRSGDAAVLERDQVGLGEGRGRGSRDIT